MTIYLFIIDYKLNTDYNMKSTFLNYLTRKKDIKQEIFQCDCNKGKQPTKIREAGTNN